MVPGMNDTFFDLLAPRVTVYGMKGINPNLASAEVLKSLDPAMTTEVAKEIIKRRDNAEEGGPFKCNQTGGSDDFWNFVESKGIRPEGKVEEIPLICDSVINFKIRSTGEFAGASREITAIVMNLQKTADKVKTYVKKDQSQDQQQQQQQVGQQGQQGQQQSQSAQIPKGPPRIVYWNEK